MMKEVAVVVVYNPSHSLLALANILLASSCDVYFVNNGNPSNIYWKELASKSAINTVQLDTNRGTAGAVNYVLLTLDEDIAFLFDQDSMPGADYFSAMRALLPFKSNVGLIGANYGQVKRVRKISNALTIILSGSVVNVKVFKQLNGFNESYFLDLVDFEFVLRLKREGYKSWLCHHAVLNHQLGQMDSSTHSIFTSTHHSADRRFDIAKNTIRIVKDYFWVAPWWCIKKLILLVLSWILIILFEGDKLNKLKRSLAGTYFGIFKIK